jgi:uncharacterized protein
VRDLATNRPGMRDTCAMKPQRPRRRALVTLFTAFTFAGLVSSGPLEDADAAYERGDYATALRLLQPLASSGDDYAQFNIGVMYDTGKGVPQDFSEAVKWYRKAANQGNARAMDNLAFMYRGGQGVPQDYVEAHKWFNLAASRYSVSEAKRRESAALNRDLVANRMTPQQIAEAQKLAREWKPTK